MSRFLSIFLFGVLSVSSVSISAQQSAVGRDFWIGFNTVKLNADTSNIVRITFAIVDEEEIGGATISGPGFRKEYNKLKRGGSVVFDIDSVVRRQMMKLEEGKDNFGIHLESEMDVMVYVSSHTKKQENGEDGDATMILPTPLLGTQYFALSHNEQPSEKNSEIAIVATENDTWIDIIPSANTVSHKAGELFSINLHAGQRYQIQSNDDLSGTIITLNRERNTTCKPFAVFAGSVETTIGSRTRPGHLFNQMFPLELLGRNYSVLPFEQLGNEYLLKIVSSEDNNVISSNGRTVGAIAKAGGIMNLRYDDLRHITATKPIQVGQFFTGLNEQRHGPVDPFMMILSADEHMLSSASIPTTTFLGHTGTINGAEFQSVVFFGDEQEKYENESPNFEANIKTFTPKPEFSYSIYNADQGLKTTAEKGFAYYRYNLGRRPDVANLGLTINTGFTKLDTLSIEAPDTVCVLDSFVFRPAFSGRDGVNPKYDEFEWDFGNGSKAIGDSIEYQYGLAGIYNVQLIASASNSLCIVPDTAYKVIRVIDFNLDGVLGAASVCPNTTSVEYETLGAEGSLFTWSIEGGEIVTNDNNRIVVNWGATNPDAYVQVISENPFCDNDTLKYPVVVTDALMPAIPVGVAELCLVDVDQLYKAGFVDGATYTWEIENGQILSGQGSNVISVRWNGAGLGRVWYTESRGEGDSLCSGVSEILDVIIYDDLLAEPIVTHVSCFEEEDASIQLNVSGGKIPYRYFWKELNEFTERVDDLPVGEYEVLVSDAIGCETTQVIRITQPELLTVSLELENVRCNGTSTGTAVAIPTGGTSPYRYFWDGQLGEQINTNLGVGSHLLRILDANDCVVSESFELTEPEPLMAVTTDNPTCPGEENGSIFVEANGGTPPYTYRWNTSPPQDAQLIEGLPAGKYSVTVTDRNGCTFTFDEEEIFEKPPVISLPNIFSPNGDGFNDVFAGVSNCNSGYAMKVYSQWGELLFYTDNAGEGWDGTYRGKEVPQGTYSYIVSYTADINGHPLRQVLRGTVRIQR